MFLGSGMRQPFTQRHSSAFSAKVDLRARAIEGIDNPRILDAYSAGSALWRAVEKLTGKTLRTLSLDTTAEGTFKIDNRIALRGLDLDLFDVIDLDAYGTPWPQLDIVMRRGFRGTLVGTCIRLNRGWISKGLAVSGGMSAEMYKACPPLASRFAKEILLNYLCLFRVDMVRLYHYRRGRYMYFSFEVK